MGEPGSGWCTIESEPAVFTELLSEIGVRGVQVEEAYSLDFDALKALCPLKSLHGLVFLFHYGGERPDTSRGGKLLEATPPNLFFAKQVITNACATQALISIVLNCLSVDIGDELRTFRDFCVGAALDAETAGLTISNSSKIRDAHNSFAPPVHFSLESNRPKQKEDAFHFVAYVPVDGHLYELDGLQPGPRDHGPVGFDWRQVAAAALQARTATFNESEIRFSLMAVVDDVADRLNATISNAEATDSMKEAAREALAEEMSRRAVWQRDNQRRRHNFLPFIVAYLKAAERKGVLDGAVKVAIQEKDKAIAKATKKEANGSAS